MDLLNPTSLAQLAEREETGTHVSLFIPTHRFGDAVETDPLRWKNLLSEVETTLASHGLDKSAVDSLLAPAWELHRDSLTWQHMKDGLAFFLRPGWSTHFRLPIDVPQIAMVGDRFVTSPLLPVVTDDAQFLLLAVSQRRVRLLSGDHQGLEDIELDDVPTDLRDIIEPHDPRSNTMARPTSGGRAVFFGHGAGDDHFKTDELERFLRQVANGLQHYLADKHLPMVMVGLDELVAMYRGVNQYAHLADEDVRTNPDELSSQQLHEAAWPVIGQKVQAKRADEAARFHQLLGTGKASQSVAEVEVAAREGRVETLFVADDIWASGETPSTPPVVSLGRDTELSDAEALDRAAIDTLTHGGVVHAVPAKEMPADPVAATFRY